MTTTPRHTKDPRTQEALALLSRKRQARQAVEQAADRLIELQAITSRLAGAMTVEQIGVVLDEELLPAFGADRGAVFGVDEGARELVLLRLLGASPGTGAEWSRVRMDANLPLAEAARTGSPVWLADRAAGICRYPLMASVFERWQEHARAVLPLAVDGRPVGCLLLGFRRPRAFPEHEQAFGLLVAHQAAQALERSQLFREAEEARDRAEMERARIQRVVDVIPEAVVVCDGLPLPRWIVANAACQKLLGSDVSGMPMPIHDEQVFGSRRLDGSAIAARELPLQRALLDGETVVGEQLVFGHLVDGHELLVLANAAPLRDGRGRITGAVASFQEISAIKELERQKDAFLATVSHDLQQPLAALRAQTQLLQRVVSRAGPDAERTRIRTGLARMRATVDEMVLLLTELHDAARLEAGRAIELQRETTDLVTLVRELVASYALASDLHRFRLELAETLPAFVDPTRMKRVISNVLSNAVKYSPGGGEVLIRVAEDPDLRPRTALILVQDGGLGIPVADVPRAFEKFHRGSNVPAGIAGSGLGLAGASRIVSEHGGTIDLESVEGVGTTVTLRLPIGEG